MSGHPSIEAITALVTAVAALVTAIAALYHALTAREEIGKNGNGK